MGSRAWFESVERERYLYAPWMEEPCGFRRFGGQRLLEVGCGLGTDLIQFARHGAKVTGLDLTPRHLELAQRRFEVFGMPGEFVLGDAEALPFADGSFDAAYSFGVLHHTPGTQAAIDEIHRVLRPGGSAIIVLYHRRSYFYWAVVARWLPRDRWRGRSFSEQLARIEAGTSDALPLVKLYTKSQLRRMCTRFGSVKLSVRHMTLPRFVRQSPLRPPAWLVERLSHVWGWCVIADCTK